MSKIDDVPKALTDALALSESCLPIEDLTELYQHLFNEIAQKALLEGLTPSLVNAEFYSGVAVGEHNIEKVAQRLALAVNDYAARGQLLGFFRPPTAIELPLDPKTYWKVALTGDKEWFVFIAPVLTPEGAEASKNANYPFRTQAGEFSDFRVSDYRIGD